MRLDAREGDQGWQCFDVERSAVVNDVVWVDTKSATWGSFDKGHPFFVFMLSAGNPPLITHHEKRIEVSFDQRMVLFNPIDDAGDAESDVRAVDVPARSVEFAR